MRAWLGAPEDPKTQTSGVGWVLAVEWVPYQRPTFVTPAFAGYVSGHSTFSRAAAEVLTAITGSEYFPGGLTTWTVKAGSFIHEDGPTQDVTLQWATYYDAADQAGISRLYGGIHIEADDLEGRKIGSTVRPRRLGPRPAVLRRHGRRLTAAGAIGGRDGVAARRRLYARSPAAKIRSMTRRLATASCGGVGSGVPSRIAAAKRLGLAPRTGRPARTSASRCAGATGGSPPAIT